MINGKKVYCILTLRENSQRIANKCFKILNGKPLFEWVFKECEKSKYIDKIYVSTSSKNYKNIIKNNKYNCEIIDREEVLSDNKTTIFKIIKSAVFYIKNNNNLELNSYIIWVDITKPLTKINDIDVGIELIDELNYDSLFTIKPFNNFLITDEAINSQELPLRYLRFSMYRIWRYKNDLSILGDIND